MCLPTYLRTGQILQQANKTNDQIQNVLYVVQQYGGKGVEDNHRFQRLKEDPTYTSPKCELHILCPNESTQPSFLSGSRVERWKHALALRLFLLLSVFRLLVVIKMIAWVEILA